jgi:hypothetical protein
VEIEVKWELPTLGVRTIEPEASEQEQAGVTSRLVI